MKTRICPLCDQPMKKAHHCDYCNSFVWKPIYLDIHYKTGYDSDVDSDCSYGKKAHEYEYHENGSVTMMPSKDTRKNKKFRGVQEIEFERYNTSEKSENDSTMTPYDRHSSKRKGDCLKKICLIIFILTIISTIYTLVEGMISEIDFEGIPEIFDAEEIVDVSTYEEEYTDAEVFRMGEECNGYEHMSMTYSDFVTEIEKQMKEQDMDLWTDAYEDSYNRAYIYGDDKNTYFNSSCMYYWEAEEGYYSIDWDTYSERLHSVAFCVSGAEDAETYFIMTMGCLGIYQAKYFDEFQIQRSIAEDEGYVFYDIEDFEIYISYYDSGDAEKSTYYVSIDQND